MAERMTPAQKWASRTEAEREAIRAEVRADRVAQGLSPEADDPTALRLTASILRRHLEQKRAAS